MPGPKKNADDDEMLFDVDLNPTRVADEGGGGFDASARTAPEPHVVAAGHAERRAHVREGRDIRANLGPVDGPTRAGRYTLLGLLGKGGMAEVFLATQDGPAGFEKTCVVKRIRRSLAEEPRFVDMFLREARVAARLNHPNAVQIFELGQDNSSGHVEYFLAMEFLDGISLHRAARRCWANGESVPMEVALRAVADAALGLHHAHTLTGNDGRPTALVHRDVSPDNVMLTRDGVSKVLDFGIAKSNDVDEMTGTGEVKGKIPFMSPEQLQGLPLDGRSDLWSLGVTMYWMLTGKRPFDASSEPMTIDAIMRKDPVPPREVNPLIPHPVEEIVMDLLKREPDNRVSSGAVLAERILGILGPSAGYAAAATFAAKAMQWEDADPKQPASALTILAARPESQWLKRLDDNSKGLERLFPPATPTGQRRAVEQPSTSKTVTGLHKEQGAKRSNALPIAAGVLAAGALAVAAIVFLAQPEDRPPPALALATTPTTPTTPTNATTPTTPTTPTTQTTATTPTTATAPTSGADGVEPKEPKEKGVLDRRLDKASVRTAGPAKISWRTGKQTLGKGAQSFKVAKGTAKLTAVDTETGGVSEVAIVDGVADYKALGTGTVLVRVKPWANVELGTKKLGETPIDPLTLPAGRYTFKLTRESLTKSATVEVKAGATATVNVDLRD